ncbi:helix-turn-helix domain-containing protein [Paraburkholderia sp. EG304]|uniref:helix-turn-helix domain-containing protein n=1 Tax=Paraburkholderia sp. EG304 TaxID=3237015 RepID=UPI00397D9362
MKPEYARAYSPAMNIGDNLDKAMKARAIESQKALERLSGVPQPTINRILKGNTPDIGTAKKLADALGISVTWLIDQSGVGPNSSISEAREPLSDVAESLIRCVERLDGLGIVGRKVLAGHLELLTLAGQMLGMQDVDVIRELRLQEQKLADHVDQARGPNAARTHERKRRS